MQCNNAELLSEGAPFSADDSVQQIYKLALLCRIAAALDPLMTCDPATLLSEGAPFVCLAPELQRIVELQLLCEISGGLGPGIATQVQCGTTNPIAPPAGNCGLFINTASQELFFWNGTAWILKV